MSNSSTAFEDITENIIDSILESARNRNNTLDVTGCLVFHKSSFVQIIEGDKNKIKPLFEEIKEDRRHFNIKLLWEGDNEERNFSGWNMAY